MSNNLLNEVRRRAIPLADESRAIDFLLDAIGSCRFVLIGEASHGTHEFYRIRAEITKRLIAEKGFTHVAIEADFPDALRVNRFVRGESLDRKTIDRTAEESLRAFARFPVWMWRNEVVRDFVGWMRDFNNTRPLLETKAGFIGIDLYSLHASAAYVLNYLRRIDTDAARRAHNRYSCLERFRDSREYGYATARGITDSCEAAVVGQLAEMYEQATVYANRDGELAAEEYFFAEQNARLVQNAEEYYRTMYRGGVSSWNLRDRHMAETIDALVNFEEWRGREARVVVWAHNSHLGDARATEMGANSEWNVGQLVRERYGEQVFIIGFTTHTGTVTAATNWDEMGETKRVRQSLEGSIERLFHETKLNDFLLLLTDDEIRDLFREPVLERAIGVIYRPQTERQSHYFHARIAEQFDAVIHLNETRAVTPLEIGESTLDASKDAPETYPFAE